MSAMLGVLTSALTTLGNYAKVFIVYVSLAIMQSSLSSPAGHTKSKLQAADKV